MTPSLPGRDRSAIVVSYLAGVTGVTLISRIDAQDRALFTRWVIAERASGWTRGFWRTLTHGGGAVVTIALCTLPLLLDGAIRRAALDGAMILLISHLLVQVVKRTVGRPRPSCTLATRVLTTEPDRFSFPSGHAAAAMSVALAYAAAFPPLAPILLVLATAVGASRVCLGVHYPGDVATGQLIALATGAAVLAA